jgi:hypothetical protein
MAVEGEQLVVHRFRTGSLGLAAPDSTNPPTPRPHSFWVRLKLFFTPTQRDSVRAVCMPPGAQLVVEDIPESLHLAIGVGEIELATFTRIKAPGTIAMQCVSRTGMQCGCRSFTRASACGL